jgi:6-phosphogluconate dehydrogenase
MIGLGRMGGNMARRLLQDSHDLVVYDRDHAAVGELTGLGASGAHDLADVCAKLSAPRVVWLMVPAGAPVDDTLDRLEPHLAAGDIVIDGGNSNFRDTIRRATRLRERRIELVDAGTSGGIWGLENGYCLMIGGAAAAVGHCEPIFQTLAPESGYAHVGPPGAGHYVKMVHNGIEYGMLQAYAEGYEILHASQEFSLDLHQVAALWNRGSVVRSWLNELAERAFAGDAHLADVKGYVEDSGEGRWTVTAAIDEGVPAHVLTAALYERFSSRGEADFADRLLSAMRYQFGGHHERGSAAGSAQKREAS